MDGVVRYSGADNDRDIVLMSIGGYTNCGSGRTITVGKEENHLSPITYHLSTIN